MRHHAEFVAVDKAELPPSRASSALHEAPRKLYDMVHRSRKPSLKKRKYFRTSSSIDAIAVDGLEGQDALQFSTNFQPRANSRRLYARSSVECIENASKAHHDHVI
jgi:hypothetical protein